MIKMKNVGISSVLVLGTFMLGACGHEVYKPEDFVNPNKVVEKQVDKPVLPEVNATYGIGNDPAVVKAYNKYKESGERQTINGEGWKTYAYSPNTKPIIACSPFHFCIVQLEAGEKLNSIGLGDTLNWQTNYFITGEGQSASVSVQLKPVKNNTSTDLTISTNKRTYLIGLVVQPQAGTTVLRFYYPDETMIDSLKQVKAEQAKNPNDDVISSSSTQIDLGNVNFNYSIKGDNLPWRPVRIFDDGNKTYIQMPALASKFDLPVLYLSKNKQLQMVNYRYKEPYFIVDGLFSRALLVSGKGSDQERIEIINENLD